MCSCSSWCFVYLWPFFFAFWRCHRQCLALAGPDCLGTWRWCSRGCYLWIPWACISWRAGSCWSNRFGQRRWRIWLEWRHPWNYLVLDWWWVFGGTLRRLTLSFCCLFCLHRWLSVSRCQLWASWWLFPQSFGYLHYLYQRLRYRRCSARPLICWQRLDLAPSFELLFWALGLWPRFAAGHFFSISLIIRFGLPVFTGFCYCYWLCYWYYDLLQIAVILISTHFDPFFNRFIFI